jgi:hypothetical protein
MISIHGDEGEFLPALASVPYWIAGHQAAKHKSAEEARKKATEEKKKKTAKKKKEEDKQNVVYLRRLNGSMMPTHGA